MIVVMFLACLALGTVAGLLMRGITEWAESGGSKGVPSRAIDREDEPAVTPQLVDDPMLSALLRPKALSLD